MVNIFPNETGSIPCGRAKDAIDGPPVRCTVRRLLSVYGRDAPTIARKWAEAAMLNGNPKRIKAWLGITRLVCRRLDREAEAGPTDRGRSAQGRPA